VLGSWLRRRDARARDALGSPSRSCPPRRLTTPPFTPTRRLLLCQRFRELTVFRRAQWPSFRSCRRRAAVAFDLYCRHLYDNQSFVTRTCCHLARAKKARAPLCVAAIDSTNGARCAARRDEVTSHFREPQHHNTGRCFLSSLTLVQTLSSPSSLVLPGDELLKIWLCTFTKVQSAGVSRFPRRSLKK
jgi:hypothetical protein